MGAYESVPWANHAHKGSQAARRRVADVIRLAREVVVGWRRRPPGEDAAALAYYTAFAIAPVLLLLTRALGWWLGSGNARHRIVAELDYYAGRETARVIESILKQVSRSDGVVATFIAIPILLIAAFRVLGVLREALNRLWDVSRARQYGWRGHLRKRLLSFSIIACAGALFVASVLLSAVLGSAERWFASLLPDARALQAANVLLSFVLLTLLFAAIYRFVPDAPVEWRNVWPGAVLASILFAMGRFLLGLFFQWSALGAAYVAAGSILAVLLWLYYSAHVLLLGARITRAHMDLRGPAVGHDPRGQTRHPACADGRNGRTAAVPPGGPLHGAS